MLALEVRIFGDFCFTTMNVWPFQWWVCGLRLLFRRGGLYTTAVFRQGLDVLFGTPKHRPWFFPPLTLGLIGWLWPIWFVIFGSRLRVDCGLLPWFQWLLCFLHIPKFIWGSVWHIHLAHSFAAIKLCLNDLQASPLAEMNLPKTRAPFSATKRPIKASKAKNMARHLAPHGSDFFYRLLMRKKLQTSDRWRGFRLRMTLRMNSFLKKKRPPFLRPQKCVDLQIDHGFWGVFNIKGMELLKTSGFAEGFDILKSCYISFSIALISSLWGRCNGQVLW